jgi:hypothetical protein
MKKITSKIITGVLVLMFGLSLDSQVVYNETFGSSLGGTSASGGYNGNWIWTGTCARSSMSGHSTNGSALFQGTGCTYGGTGYGQSSGNLTTPSILIGTYGATLTFNYYLQNECTAYSPNQPCYFDYIDVQVSTNGGGSYTSIMSSNNFPGGMLQGTSWSAASYVLDAATYGGQNVLIRFFFNTIDGFGNNFDGAYVDDIKVENIPACTTTPAANAIVATPTLLCPGYGTAGMTFTTGYNVGGITYTWMSSTLSAVGPFTPVPGATLTSFVTPTLNNVTWYTAVIGCAPTGQTYTTATITMSVAGTTTNSIPYLETFEGIGLNDQLPNCSWIANSPTTICQTYTAAQNQNRVPHTGSKFAAFATEYVTGSNYFYTNGLQLFAGVTYSASLWYTTEFYGYTNVTDLSMLVGPSQSTTGLVPIVSTGGPATSPVHKVLGNTFTVPNNGMYYVAVRATTNGNYGVRYLSWDDLSVTIPCALNSPTVSLSAGSTTVCNGETVNLTASGADSYSWSTGATGASMSDMPNSTTTYIVVGTNTVSGCQTSQSQLVIVNPAPQLSVFADEPIVCAGKPVNLTVFGAMSYTWGNSTHNAVMTATPNTTTTYTVIGANQYNCSTTSTLQVFVNPNPVISVTSNAPDPSKICKGEMISLTGNGAGAQGSYQWASASLFIQAPVASISPNTTTAYTLTGTDANGCSGSTTYVQTVTECTGINEITTTLKGVKIYPNPTAGIFTVELKNSAAKTIEVADLTGRIVYTNTSSNEKINVNINNLANGIYYVKIQSADATEVVKILKD